MRQLKHKSYLPSGPGSKRGSLGGGSDIEDYPGGDPHLRQQGAPGSRGARHPATTDQYYADQYDQYYR